MSTPAGSSIVSASGSTDNGSTGWVVSRTVLYFGVASVVVVWASAFSCLMCHCMRRRRRNQTAAAQAAAEAQAAGSEGAPRYFPTTLPVVVINPDNIGLELGVKEEGAYAQQSPLGGNSKVSNVDIKPSAASPASWGSAPHGSDSASSLFPLPPPPPPRALQPWPPQDWQRGQRGQQPPAQQYAIQMGQAGVWVPADDDGPSAGSSSSSQPTTSPGAGVAWGYRGTG